MEGLPRISMISLDLKETNETPDFSCLYSYIESNYNERSETYKESFKEFLNLRKASVSGSESLTYLANMKKYFCQLQLFKQRFPLYKENDCLVNWSWEDSHSNATVNINDIRLEEASILYNIGSLHCNLGCIEKRVDLDSTKIACTHFQCAAWAFQRVLEQYAPMSSSDLECDVLRYLNLLMLAQAHECLLEKSMVDKRTASISSKIAFQISDLYKQCQGLLQSENIGYTVNSKQYKLWKRTCVLKEHLYYCLSYYYMAVGAEDAQKYGEIIAWLKLAKERLDKCNKALKDIRSSEAEETIRFIHDVVNGKFESAKKDNDFIYYDKVPEPEMLPQIKGALLLKGIGFDVNDTDICGHDIFKNLISMETHISSSIYSEKKAEILRNILSEVEEKKIEMEHFLNNIHWSPELFSLEDAKVPQAFYNCAAYISANTDEISKIKRIMQDISSISIEVEESLEMLSNRMRSANIDKSSAVWKKYEKEYTEFVSNFEDAKESNNQLRDVFSRTLNDFMFISQPTEQALGKLATLKTLSESSETAKSIDECRRLMAKVDEMVIQRCDLSSQLKTEMMSDDIAQLLLSCKTESEQNKIIAESLKKYDEKIGYLKQNMAAQANIIDAIVDHNAKIADLNARIEEIKNEREKCISSVVVSFDKYKDLVKKGEEGINFYRIIGTKILKLQNNIDSLIPQPPSIEPTVPKETAIVDQPEEFINKSFPSRPVKDAISSQSDGVNNYSLYSFPSQLPDNSQPRLKDYLKERKTRHSLSGATAVQPVSDYRKENTMQQYPPLSTNQYPYMPWGYYGPPCQGPYNSNYAVSKPRDQGSEFRITQNIQMPAASSEVGCSVYPSYSSLPRPGYSQSSSLTNPGNMTASIDNLSSTALPVQQFTIPYQQQPFYSPNVISMAHSSGRSSIPIQEHTQHVTDITDDSHNYFPNTALDHNYQSQLPNQNPSLIYHQNVHYNESMNDHSQANFPHSNYYQGSQAQPQFNQSTYPNSQSYYGYTNPCNMTQNYQKFNPPKSEIRETSIGDGVSSVPRNQAPYPSTQAYYSDAINAEPTNQLGNYPNAGLTNHDHRNNHYGSSQYGNQQMLMSNINYYDNSLYSNIHEHNSISSPQQHDFLKESLNSFSNTPSPVSQNRVLKPLLQSDSLLTSQANTDLLSSSPTNNLNPTNSRAILEPTVLTKQEIEDQKEEKRKQIYRKQCSGSNHPLNDNLTLNKFISDAERFMKRMSEILDPTNNKALEQHWTQLINKERLIPRKSSAIAKCSPMKNRIQDSVPYDENRVVIKDGKDDYVNASHISLQNIDECLPRFIAFQSPLPNTLNEFWTAVFEQSCELLVQLAQPCVKDDTSKARVVSYWPDIKGQNLSVGNKFEISVQSVKEKSNWTERILLMKHLKSNQSRSIWHFQVNNVSNKLPKSHDEFLAFVIELSGYYRQQRSLTKPIGISCMSGTSVCGVMILLTTALTIMEITGQFPDIDAILMAMWAQRKNLLDDKHQLSFVYKAVSKASSDMLSKRNIVIGPGRLVANIHTSATPPATAAMANEHSSTSIPVTVSQPTATSILDSIFTTQHLQLSELSTAISKWTIKSDEKQGPEVALIEDSGVNIIKETKNVIKVEQEKVELKKKKDLQLPSSLKHLEDPSTIDFTPTPSDKRKITKKEFEQKMNKSYVKPTVDPDNSDPLRSLDPIYNNQ